MNMTLCFSAMQAVMAARSGAKWISPFIGRLDEAGRDGADAECDLFGPATLRHDRVRARSRCLDSRTRTCHSRNTSASPCGHA